MKKIAWFIAISVTSLCVYLVITAMIKQPTQVVAKQYALTGKVITYTPTDARLQFATVERNGMSGLVWALVPQECRDTLTAGADVEIQFFILNAQGVLLDGAAHGLHQTSVATILCPPQ